MDQLRKMYKSEELTTATADIVIKRALRRLEQSQVYLKMQEERREKTRAQDYPIARQRVSDNLEQARQALASLRAAQDLAGVTRKASLANARIAVEQAEQKLGDLKTDAALFSIKAPHEGVIQYGNIAEGSWQGGDPKNLKAGERLAPGAIAMRLFQPGKLKLEIGLSESQAFALEPGMKAKVTPSAFPQLAYDATCGGPVMTPRGNPPAFGFQSTLALPDLDPKLVPGMKAQVKVNAVRAENVLLVPLNAISDGKVSVREDGKTTKREVSLGQSDGKQVEIKSGLKEGDEIVTGAKSEK
jgi:multidrug efflux pump subunit AcrA (membrane-fusion protein)